MIHVVYKQLHYIWFVLSQRFQTKYQNIGVNKQCDQYNTAVIQSSCSMDVSIIPSSKMFNKRMCSVLHGARRKTKMSLISLTWDTLTLSTNLVIQIKSNFEIIYYTSVNKLYYTNVNCIVNIFENKYTCLYILNTNHGTRMNNLRDILCPFLIMLFTLTIRSQTVTKCSRTRLISNQEP